MVIEIKVSRITKGEHTGYWQWRMRRGQPCNPGWNGRWFARCNQPFVDADAANKSAGRMADLMKTVASEVNVGRAKYDFPYSGRSRQRNIAEKHSRMMSGVDGGYAAMAKHGVFVVMQESAG